MPPVALPGRRKTAVFQERIRQQKSLSLNNDYPENLADLAGSIDFWLKSLKAFRWHDQQLELDPGHQVTRHAIAVLLGMDRDQAARLIKRGNFAIPNGRDSYPWQQLRKPICKELVSTVMNECLKLSFEIHAN